MAKKVKVAKAEDLPAVPFKPGPEDEAGIAAYKARERERSTPPRIKITEQDKGLATIEMAPALAEFAKDKVAGVAAVARLTATFGGISYDAANCLLSNILSGTKTKPAVDERAVNESLAGVVDWTKRRDRGNVGSSDGEYPQPD